jgi:hypothetical protein
MLTTISKRIQSRLSRLGVKVALGEVKTQCEQMISDIENPGEQELLAIQEYFMSTASQLTVTTDVDNVGITVPKRENCTLRLKRLQDNDFRTKINWLANTCIISNWKIAYPHSLGAE